MHFPQIHNYTKQILHVAEEEKHTADRMMTKYINVQQKLSG